MTFTADYEKLAKGIYEILLDMESKGDDTYLCALAFGMLPAPIMQIAEDQFIEKLASENVQRYGTTVIEDPGLFAGSKREIKAKHASEFNHGLACALLRVASDVGLMVV